MAADTLSQNSGAESEQRITLDLLEAVEGDSHASQRRLAAKLDIALGLTNAYLKRCVHRGLVKVRHIPPNRYAYYLTPHGFAEKSRLTARFLASSFHFYRCARNQCDALLNDAAERGLRRIALVGGGELAEIALLCALQHDLQVVGVVDAKARANRFRHAPLVRELSSLAPVDAVLLTDVRAPQQCYEALAREVGAERILLPPLLKVARTPVSRAIAEGGA